MVAWLRKHRRLLLFLYFSLQLLPLIFISLTESTEARYAEIAREMLASGN